MQPDDPAIWGVIFMTEAVFTAAQAIPTASLTSGAAGVYAGVAPWYGPAIALSSSLALDSHLALLRYNSSTFVARPPLILFFFTLR